MFPAMRLVDIARAANVSTATIVRVISKNGYVSEKTRKNVEEVIEKYGYFPNKVARSLRTKTTNMIGLIMPQDTANPFFAQISDAISRAAHDAGYHVISLITNYDMETERGLVEEMTAIKVDGIIFSSYTFPDVVIKIVQSNMPVVMIERPNDVYGINKILVDDEEGSYIAARHFIEKGHTRLAFIGQKLDGTVEINRHEGFLKACREFELSIGNSMMQFVDHYRVQDGYSAAKEILKQNSRPTGIFAASDILAAGVMQCLYDAGIRVPDDMSVIGYDNTLSQMTAPKLTSIGYPMEEIGKYAVQMIVDKIQNQQTSTKTITLSPHMVQRNSVKSLVPELA